MHVAMTMREYSSFDITEEVFKGFYHYVLLGFQEPAYLRQKRLKLYKLFVKILKNPKLRESI
jgi:hypothetical protein